MATVRGGFSFRRRSISLINKLLRRFDLQIRPITKNPADNVYQLPNVQTIIDIGVFKGTPNLYDAFRGSKLILVDPLLEYKDEIANRFPHRDIAWVEKAVGNTNGSMFMNVDANLGRSSFHDRTNLSKTNRTVEQREVEIVTLDDLASSLVLNYPVGLKIDTEGHELEVLKGGINVIPSFSWIIAEVSISQRFHNSYIFEDLIEMTKHLGFRVKHFLSGPNRDGNMHLVDMAFVRSDLVPKE